MKPTHCIFKLVDSRLSCGVVELPEEPSLIGYTKGTALKVNQDYKEQYQQAIANAIWFREEKDVSRVTQTIWRDDPQKRLPELMKPYKLPEGLEIEIRDEPYFKNANLSEGFIQFAFLKEPKEQENKWDARNYPPKPYRSGDIAPVNLTEKWITHPIQLEQEKEESQDDPQKALVDHLIKTLGVRRIEDSFTWIQIQSAILDYKFTIQRK